MFVCGRDEGITELVIQDTHNADDVDTCEALEEQQVEEDSDQLTLCSTTVEQQHDDVATTTIHVTADGTILEHSEVPDGEIRIQETDEDQLTQQMVITEQNDVDVERLVISSVDADRVLVSEETGQQIVIGQDGQQMVVTRGENGQQLVISEGVDGQQVRGLLLSVCVRWQSKQNIYLDRESWVKILVSGNYVHSILLQFACLCRI